MQILNSRVSSVEAGNVTISNKGGGTTEVPFGACVWATGVAKHPLISQVQEKLPNQTHFRALLTDDCLRVLGTNGSMWAIGDASTVWSPKALDYADELFEEADQDRTGALSLSELRVRPCWPHDARSCEVHTVNTRPHDGRGKCACVALSSAKGHCR